jgi:hypothetical protein
MNTIRLRVRSLVGLGAWLWAVPALPQAATPAPPPDRLQGYARLSGMVFDNFFEATDGSPGESVLASSLGGGATFRLSERSPLTAHVAAEYVVYQGFDPSQGITAGIRFEGRPHGGGLTVRYLRGRPGREVGDQFDRANAVAVSGEYSYRITNHLQLIGLAQFRHETYALFPDRSTDGYELGAAVRYRGLGSGLSPELGATVGGRSVSGASEDLALRDGYLRLRWSATPSLYLSARYRRRGRSYSITDVSARNFGRDDTRHQLMMAADWTRGDLIWNLYYTLEDAHSSVPSGNFKTQMLSLGLTLPF